MDAEWKLKASEADYKNLEVQLASQVLAQKSEAAKSQSEYSQAKMQADTDSELQKLGVISDNSLKVSSKKSRELATRNEIEHQRLANASQVLEAQLQPPKRAEVEQIRALFRLKQNRLGGLRDRSEALRPHCPATEAAAATGIIRHANQGRGWIGNENGGGISAGTRSRGPSRS